MTNVRVSDGQSLLDITLQECGAVEALFDLADANGLAITDPLTAGQVLLIPTSQSGRPDLVAYYTARQHRVNTGDSVAVAPPEPPTTNHDFDARDFDARDFD